MNFLPFLLAKRFYIHQNKQNKVLIISILSKIGISVSIFALIVSLSALNGFHILLNKTLLSSFPHGIIQLTDKSLLKWQDIVKTLKFFPGIFYCEPYIVTSGLLVNKNIVKIVEIKSFKDIKYFEKDFLTHVNSNFLKKK